jgi:hypothetical protein
MSLTVTIKDNVTGHRQSQQVADDDYLLLITGSCYVERAQTNWHPGSRTGTHVLTIKSIRESGGMINTPVVCPLPEFSAPAVGAPVGPFTTDQSWTDP